MNEPNMTPLSEVTHNQLIGELKRRHVGGIIGTISEIKDRTTIVYAWGPISLRAGLMFILHEVVRQDVSEWGEEVVKEWREDE